MLIALASPRVARSLAEGLQTVRNYLSDAANRKARLVCFPEAWLPGLRGQDFEVVAFAPEDYLRVLHDTAQWCREYNVSAIPGLEKPEPDGRRIVAVVIDCHGQVLGEQTKNQLDPSEDRFHVPGHGRRLFEINGLRFGIAICHEGWRYPETVRWAATRGAHIVFHPQLTGSNTEGRLPAYWGDPDAPYYEKAMMLRAIENTIYFASVNYCVQYQEAATSLIHASGKCQAFPPYGQEGLLIQELHLDAATGLLAQRFAPDRFIDATNQSDSAGSPS